MKRPVRLLPFLLFPLLLATACTPTPATVQLQPSARLRVSAAVVDAQLNLSATLEGGDGQALSGALAQATDPSGALNVLPYNSAKGAYTATLPADTGTYRLTVDSSVAGLLTADIPVKVLSQSPDVIDVQDGAGNSVKNFQRLSAATPLRVSWTATPSATKYLLEVRQLGRVVSSSLTTETSLVLPAGTLASSALPGTPASVAVTASAQSGDPAYKTANVLSSSSVTAPSLGFQMVP
jgi:hypothetical protein